MNDRQGKPEIDDIAEEVPGYPGGLKNPFLRNPTRNTRAQIEAYLEKKMPGQWDEWNVRMTKLEWDREDRIMRDLEGR